MDEVATVVHCAVKKEMEFKEEPEFELSNEVEDSMQNNIETDFSLFQSQLHKSDEEEEIKPPLAVFIVANDGDDYVDDEKEAVEYLKPSAGIIFHGTEEETGREEGKDCEDADPDIKEELIAPCYGVKTISAHCYGNNTSIIDKGKYSSQKKNYKNKSVLPCGICDRSFKRMKSLLIHQRRIHKVESPFQCDICKKYFNCQKILDSHKYIHTGEWRCICNICNKGFNSRGRLLFHERSHKREMPFQCDLCEKGFKQKESLLNHKSLIHTIENPFQ